MNTHHNTIVRRFALRVRSRRVLARIRAEHRDTYHAGKYLAFVRAYMGAA